MNELESFPFVYSNSILDGGYKGSWFMYQLEHNMMSICIFTGYYHGDERVEKEKAAFMQGFIVGLGLALMFLVFFISALCYTKIRDKP